MASAINSTSAMNGNTNGAANGAAYIHVKVTFVEKGIEVSFLAVSDRHSVVGQLYLDGSVL